ncbi:alpha-acetolactate decarboxylase [Staphylococcus microti]|uniref:Alpha-acetolactate decarboxylase n=1 Tax=Staphylococcus microti TaxID=569857 RepID=A0A0D6XQ60_9STAP|nr:acetolactate decarboxylase [Staphylococcus microti]KIX90939.1 alpha-acetolactate decarboxylase [Staphylococcus microti]PNZ83778.1 acetolactate decarboxylase [Staphylococcus microti]SUM58489.1 alpha-acetolactate decarboxylase [Staphylococcus microti]
MQHTLFQHGTLGTLMAGALEGTCSIDTLLQHGDHGIATLTGSDGEVIFVDGQAFHATTSDSDVHKLTGDALTPYASVSKFSADTTFESSTSDHETLYQKIREQMLSENLFAMVKITGTFQHMHVRIMPKQNPPYTRLITSAKAQPEYHRDNISGTIVAVYTPEVFHGIGAAGFHAHFISEDRTFMGHILGFDLAEGTIQIQNCARFEQHLSTDPSFLNKTFDYEDIAEDIRQAE